MLGRLPATFGQSHRLDNDNGRSRYVMASQACFMSARFSVHSDARPTDTEAATNQRLLRRRLRLEMRTLSGLQCAARQKREHLRHSFRE